MSVHSLERHQNDFSNKVWQYTSNMKYVTFFLPAYLRLTFKKITAVDIADASAQMSATMILTVKYQGLDKEMVKRVVRNMEIALNDDEFYSLCPDSKNQKQRPGQLRYKNQEAKGEFTITWRTRFPLELECENVFLTPFNLFKLELACTLRSIDWEHDGKKFSVKFNLMDPPEEDRNQLFTVNTNEKGEYSIAEGKVEVDIPEKLKGQPNRKDQPQQKLDREKWRLHESQDQMIRKTTKPMQLEQEGSGQKKKFKNWQNIRFRVGLYKDPFSAVFSIILPLILLAIINLFIFFQSNDLGSRIASIATLLVAFMAFLPTVRELIPPTPTVIGLDIILLLFLVAELLTAIQAMLAFDIPAEEYKFQWTTDPIYLICVAFIMLVALPVLIMVVLHYARWVGQYHNKDKNTSTDINFSSSKWFNEDVDVYLKELKERQDGTLEELKSSQTN